MSAGEFAFLAFGLVLGIAAGAALLELVRSRPPAPREVRLTVSTDSVPRRPATLASAAPLESVGPAPFGPGDRPAVDRQGTDAGLSVAGGVAGALGADASGTAVLTGGTLPIDAIARPLDGAQTDVAVPPLVGIAIEPEADPVLASIRRASVVAVAAGGGSGGESAGAGPVRAASGGGAESGSVGPSGSGALGGAVAGPAGEAVAVAAAVAGTGDEGRPQDATEPPVATVVEAGAASPEAGPCAELRRAAEERCAVAEGLGRQAEAAAAALRERQRESDEHETNAAKASDESDPHRLRAAKEAAQHEFRVSSASAASGGAVEAAARTWLGEINRINRLAREAALTARREGEAAAALVPVLERLSVEADAARINAESAREACLAAREALAACEEAAVPPLVASAALAATGGPTGAGAATGPPAAAAASGAAVSGAAGESGALFDAETLDVAAAAGLLEAAEPVLFRILAGDRMALRNVAVQLAGDEPSSAGAWEGWLADLVEAIEARAIEASSLDFPVEHRFWGPFTREQCREIAAALGSLGYRFDGAGGFVDERIPSQRDLSLAVGFAGLDPMRIRRWPNEAEMPDLFREVRVASDEYISAAAPGITLGEMVTLLGRRADGLTELWNAWGRVRPLLLAPA